MTESEAKVSSSNGSDSGRDLDALRQEIEQTRADLGETVQALAAKADVKARVRDSAGQAKARVLATAAQAKEKVTSSASQTAVAVRDSAGEAGHSARRNPVPVAAVAAGAAAILLVLLIIRGRRNK